MVAIANRNAENVGVHRTAKGCAESEVYEFIVALRAIRFDQRHGKTIFLRPADQRVRMDQEFLIGERFAKRRQENILGRSISSFAPTQLPECVKVAQARVADIP